MHEGACTKEGATAPRRAEAKEGGSAQEGNDQKEEASSDEGADTKPRAATQGGADAKEDEGAIALIQNLPRCCGYRPKAFVGRPDLLLHVPLFRFYNTDK